MKKTCRKVALVALVAVITALGLTACQKSEAPASKADQPTNAAAEKKSEHPEHPK